ncbi:MAG: DUF4255 domain-containing protein [Ktedonobacteraceae bacterium]
MSNALAIAAVTTSLVNLISTKIGADPALNLPSGIGVTTQPPDAANNDTNFTHQVNLFLYHAMPNAAWRNMPIPARGDSAQPPLALNLYYMITAYAREQGDSGDIASHNLLGRAMRVLFDHPVLSSTDITFPGSDVENQVDRIRITMQPLTIEELYRLWTGFQTQYRLSVSYEVSVILIESSRAVITPLPVLKLGATGRGVIVTPDIFPYPVLFSVQLANAVLPVSPGSFGGLNRANVPPIVLPGDQLVIQGHRLSSPQVNVSFASVAGTPAVSVGPDANTGDSITVTIPPDPTTDGKWPYGYYTLSVVITTPNAIPGQPPQVQTTNALTFALAPQIDMNTQPTATRDATTSEVTVTLNSVQQVLSTQDVSLLLDDLEVLPDPSVVRPAKTKSLSFTGQNIPAGNYLMRLRIDGVDSFPFVRTGYPQQPFDPIKNPPVFDPNQRITIP